MTKQVAILVDELELTDIQMGLMHLVRDWRDQADFAMMHNSSDPYVETCHSVVDGIIQLQSKLRTIKEEQFQ